jgi:hypothetical protein
MDGVKPGNVINLNVSAGLTISKRRFLSSSSNSISAQYEVFVSSQISQYNLESQLQTACSDSTFNNYLAYFATVYEAFGFLNATSTSSNNTDGINNSQEIEKLKNKSHNFENPLFAISPKNQFSNKMKKGGTDSIELADHSRLSYRVDEIKMAQVPSMFLPNISGGEEEKK